MTDVYLRLDYGQYKILESQLRNWDRIETTHTTMDGRYYHKALRLDLGQITLEIQGPAVREAVRHDVEPVKYEVPQSIMDIQLPDSDT